MRGWLQVVALGEGGGDDVQIVRGIVAKRDELVADVELNVDRRQAGHEQKQRGRGRQGGPWAHVARAWSWRTMDPSRFVLRTTGLDATVLRKPTTL